jgi:hypothetical protein
MAKFTFIFTRRVVTFETVTREISARSGDEAVRKADAMAAAFNFDCPADAEESADLELGDWTAELGDDGDSKFGLPECGFIIAGPAKA